MAFNPFHGFRKHQKVIFAILTIICMVTFVLSFGPGDIFTRLGMDRGEGRGGALTVTTLFGSKVSEADLDRLRAQRNLANHVMIMAIQEGHRNWLKDASAAVSRFHPASQPALEEIVNTARSALLPPDIHKIKDEKQQQQMIQMWEMSRARFPERIDEWLQRLRFVLRDNPKEADTVRRLAILLLQNRWLMRDRRDPERQFYFGSSTRADDLLDFLVWKHQADQLGIYLTDADLRAEINSQALSRDILTGDPQKDSQRIVSYLQAANYGQTQSLTLDRIYDALRAELRVGMAQSALMGYQPGVLQDLDRLLNTNEVPAVVTPDEFYEYFRQARTTFEVALLPIPVRSFLKAEELKEKGPSEKDLRALFLKYRDQEPNPDRDQPAFRQPRRIKVEWLSGEPGSAHYKALAAGAIAGTMGDRWAALRLVLDLSQEYDIVKHSHRLPAWTEAGFAPSFYTSLNEAENLAAVTGKTMAMAGTLASPFGTALSYQAGAAVRDHKNQAEAIAAEARERSPLAGAFVLAGAQGGALSTLATTAALFDHGGKMDRFLPYPLLQKKVMEGVLNNVARSVLLSNLREVAKQVQERKGKAEKGGDWLTELAKKYGLTAGRTAKARDPYELEDDPSLKALKDALRDQEGLMAQMQRRPPPAKFQLADHLFRSELPVYQPMDVAIPPSLFPSFMREIIVFWKSEDTPAQTYSSYAEAPADIKAAVLEAWRFQQARRLAREAADAALKEIRKKEDADAAVRFLNDRGKERGWGQVDELRGIARLNRRPAGIVSRTQYETYKAPEDHILARADFVDELLRSLHKPGDATVVWNRPESIYYLVVLKRREAPSEKEFVREVYQKTPSGDSLLERFEREQQEKFRAGVLKQLRQGSGGAVNEQGGWALDPEVRRRVDGRSRERGDED